MKDPGDGYDFGRPLFLGALRRADHWHIEIHPGAPVIVQLKALRQVWKHITEDDFGPNYRGENPYTGAGYAGCDSWFEEAVEEGLKDFRR